MRARVRVRVRTHMYMFIHNNSFIYSIGPNSLENLRPLFHSTNHNSEDFQWNVTRFVAHDVPTNEAVLDKDVFVEARYRYANHLSPPLILSPLSSPHSCHH